MKETRFIPPKGAFTRTVPIRFSHCDPAGIVYFPHYFDMFNGLIEDWYTEQLGVEYAKLILDDRHGFPFVHIETDFKIPSRMGEHLDLTLLLERIGRSSLSVIIIGHLAGIERLRARLTTTMTSLETQRSIELPRDLRDRFEAYLQLTGGAGPGNLGLRQFADLDILIRKSDVAAATKVFLGLGFSAHFKISEDQLERFIRLSYVRLLKRNSGKQSVELHWGIAPRFFGE